MNVKLLIIVVMITLLSVSGIQAQEAESGTVASIVKAPIIADGTVAGAPTDFVFNFDVSIDPNVNGYTLLEGNSISITLPEGFSDTGAFPIANITSSDTCVPGNIQCTTGVLVQGWPQRPVPPPMYTFSYDPDTNTVTFTANEDIIPNAPDFPGIKQAHLITIGFVNPDEPGEYMIEVTTEFGESGDPVTTTRPLMILPEITPSINQVAGYNEGVPNPIYQTTGTGEMTPLPFDFLLFDANGAPMNHVTVMHTSANHALLKQGEWIVGEVFIDAPAGATGHMLVTESPSAPANAPVLGTPTSRLTVMFMAGDTAGDYVLTFALHGGNAVQRFVIVE